MAAHILRLQEDMIGKRCARSVARIEVEGELSPFMPMNGLVNMTGENDARRVTANGRDEVRVACIAAVSPDRHGGVCRRGVDDPNVRFTTLGVCGATDIEQRKAIEADSPAIAPNERVVEGAKPISWRPAVRPIVPFEIVIPTANAPVAWVGIDPPRDPLNLFRTRSDMMKVEQVARDHEKVVSGSIVGQPVVPLFGEVQIGDVKNFHGVSPRCVRATRRMNAPMGGREREGRIPAGRAELVSTARARRARRGKVTCRVCPVAALPVCPRG